MTPTYLPTSREEMDRLGWEQADIILFSGDAYVDHPSFGAAVIGRTLQAAGYKVAIVPQPNWRDDLRDFRKLGRPRLFFGVSAGAMDSMVNHYTAARRLRHDDAFTAGGRHGMRPDYPTIVYTDILKRLYPDVPVVVGGIEASMRRLAHYDYWQDRLLPSILLQTPADLLVYGMGERPILEIARRLEAQASLEGILQTAYITAEKPTSDDIVLADFQACLKDKKTHALNFRHIEEESNAMHGRRIFQDFADKRVVVNPMYPPMTTEEIDRSFDLPYTRMPHPRYKDKRIPAYEMIRHSVNMHRGCFGGCAFCTISAHQGKFIASRSEDSILREVKQITRMPDFKGYISDLGGPSANMYRMGGHDLSLCASCRRPSCLHPRPCKNLNNDHRPLLDIYRKVDAMPEVKKSFVGSGVRYDLSMAPHRDPEVCSANARYNRELIARHVSGRLKVAPEHTSQRVLDIMRKPSFEQFKTFKGIFDRVNRDEQLNQQLIPYFISSHPGCTEEDMAELAALTKEMGYRLEQVQDFTPTPMTLATEIYYTGYHPYTGERVYTATTEQQKSAQRRFFFWYKPEERQGIERELHKMHREDLLARLYPGGHRGGNWQRGKSSPGQTRGKNFGNSPRGKNNAKSTRNKRK